MTGRQPAYDEGPTAGRSSPTGAAVTRTVPSLGRTAVRCNGQRAAHAVGPIQPREVPLPEGDAVEAAGLQGYQIHAVDPVVPPHRAALRTTDDQPFACRAAKVTQA